MKRNLFFACAVCACIMLFAACGDGNNSGNSTSGYAPSSIPSGQTLSGASRYFNFGHNTISLNGSAQSLGYVSFVGTPTVTYKKTSSNSATLTWSATIMNDGRWDINNNFQSYTETYSGNVTLFFISPNEGYASGSSDGRTISDEHFTLL